MQNKHVAIVATIAVAVGLGVSSIPTTIHYEKPPDEPFSGEIQEVEVMLEVQPEPEVVELPTLHPTLKRICACESMGNPNAEPRHYDKNGNVLRGVINNQDVGMCQINLFYHQKTADKMDIDLFTEAGNIEYANWLFNREGSTPWNWSRHCWQ